MAPPQDGGIHKSLAKFINNPDIKALKCPWALFCCLKCNSPKTFCLDGPVWVGLNLMADTLLAPSQLHELVELTKYGGRVEKMYCNKTAGRPSKCNKSCVQNWTETCSVSFTFLYSVIEQWVTSACWLKTTYYITTMILKGQNIHGIHINTIR